MTPPTKPPNIVFITSDQQRTDCYGFAGRRVKTPHLDRMVKEGSGSSSRRHPCRPRVLNGWCQ